MEYEDQGHNDGMEVEEEDPENGGMEMEEMEEDEPVTQEDAWAVIRYDDFICLWSIASLLSFCSSLS